jgi:hypothetical protein
MDYGEKVQLMRDEVRRVMKKYQEEDICWQEMASSIHLDPRLDLEAQVNVYATLCNKIDDDKICRHTLDEYEEEYVDEVYGVDMEVNTTVQIHTQPSDSDLAAK